MVIGGPRWLRGVVAVVLLDYTSYLWHILVHRVPALWRCHLVHHVDLDLDLTTGLRFHAGELTPAIPWRAAQIVAIGVTPKQLAIWQTLTLLSVMFHHSTSGLALWDHLHGTARWDASETSVTVGVSGYLEPSAVTLTKIVTLPVSTREV